VNERKSWTREYTALGGDGTKSSVVPVRRKSSGRLAPELLQSGSGGSHVAASRRAR
jgi:hypothetical protein